MVQSMSGKGNCVGNEAAEQAFGCMKDEFFRRRERPCFKDFKRNLDEYVGPPEYEAASG